MVVYYELVQVHQPHEGHVEPYMATVSIFLGQAPTNKAATNLLFLNKDLLL